MTGTPPVAIKLVRAFEKETPWDQFGKPWTSPISEMTLIELPHWVRDKMATFMRTTNSLSFPAIMTL